MKILPILLGGLTAASVLLIGEAVLNLWLLADAWHDIFLRFNLPPPSAAAVSQGVLKLALLGVFSMWLADAFRRAGGRRDRAALAAGLCIWFLVWAWVQWGMWLAGYVTGRVAVLTVLWGLPELPLAVWAGTRVRGRLERVMGIEPTS